MGRVRCTEFPEGSWLDAHDKWVSMPLFKLELGVAVETLWSMPGWWFGNPFFGLGLLPILLAGIADTRGAAPQQGSWFLVFAILLLIVATAAWLKYLALMRQDPEKYPFKSTYTLGLGSAFVLVVILATVHLVALLTLYGCVSQESHEFANIYMSCYLASISVVSPLKNILRRKRPCAYNSPITLELSSVKRYFPGMQKLMSGHDAHKSFPSGDACGSTVFVYFFGRLFSDSGSFAWILCVLTYTGRIYFHAHHMLDVLAGGFIAYGVCHVFGTLLVGPKCTWTTLFLIQIVSVAIIILSHDRNKSRKQKDPQTTLEEEEERD